MQTSKSIRAKWVRRGGTVIALTALSAGGIANADQVANGHRSVAVRYNNGQTERYLVTWSGDVNMRVWETGGPAVPFSGHFVDDRQCHWEISGSITRQVLMVNAVGEQFASPNLTHVYDKGKANEGASFKLLSLSGENCGSAESRRNSDLADMKRLVAGDFPATIAADFGITEVAIKQDARVVDVSEPAPEVAKTN